MAEFIINGLKVNFQYKPYPSQFTMTDKASLIKIHHILYIHPALRFILLLLIQCYCGKKPELN